MPSVQPAMNRRRRVGIVQCAVSALAGAGVLMGYLLALHYIYSAGRYMWGVGTWFDTFLLIDAVIVGILTVSLATFALGVGCCHLWQRGWRLCHAASPSPFSGC